MKPNTDFPDKRNLLAAAFLTILILFSMNVLFPSKPLQVMKETHPASEKTAAAAESAAIQTEKEKPVSPVLTVDHSFSNPSETAQIIKVKNQSLTGSFNPQTGRLYNTKLLKYKETTKKNSPFVSLLSDSYYTQSGWHSINTPIPPFHIPHEPQVLTPEKPLVLVGQNNYLKIERQVTLDDHYLISTTDKITNLSPAPVQIYFESEISREMPVLPKISNVHEGFIAVLKDRLIEEKYTDVEKESISHAATGGWFGITDKYWQTALILDKNEKGMLQFEKPTSNVFKAFFRSDPVTLNPEQTYTQTDRIFTGAKTFDLLSSYQTRYQIPKFDLTIDFGWFYFLTKPFLQILNWLYAFFGNMGIAIIVFATLIRCLLLPVATKSYESMAKMRQLQPKMQALQTRYKDDKRRLQMEVMNLYKREKVNPASGCLPMFLQIPVFYALYKVLSVSIDMRQAPFYGWIDDLSLPDPSSVFTAFGYFEWSIPSFLNIGILPLIMGATMFVQQKLSPAPSDPAQANVLKWMPILFMFMLGGFAAGLVLYWTWSNILSILQQKYIMHKVGIK